jgi:hypothetical protein
MSAIKPKLARSAAVISEQMENSNQSLGSLFVLVPSWAGADGCVRTLGFANTTHNDPSA